MIIIELHKQISQKHLLGKVRNKCQEAWEASIKAVQKENWDNINARNEQGSVGPFVKIIHHEPNIYTKL